jgi:glycosyltransferase involved in cell wall biosynthesis
MVDLLIICPVFNEAKSIGRLLASLSKQGRSNFSVLFVDSGSADGTWQILDLFCKGRLDCELIRFDEGKLEFIV